MVSPFHFLRSAVAALLRNKTVPAALTGGQWSGTNFVDSFRRNRAPTPNELLAELKSTAFTCASINASVCASYPPRLFVTTHPGQPEPKCLTGPVGRSTELHIRRHAAGRPVCADAQGGAPSGSPRPSAAHAAAAGQPGP